jgi:hypothetical protein
MNNKLTKWVEGTVVQKLYRKSIQAEQRIQEHRQLIHLIPRNKE